MTEVNPVHSSVAGQEEGKSAGTVSYLSLAQGIYYFLTGLWAIVSIRTFQMVTGPKTDTWLVKTVGILVMATGATLGLSAFRRKEPIEIPILALGSAAGLAGIDIYYSAKKRISPIYLLDALMQLVIIIAWISSRGSRL